ncbi:hypothetical protein C8Q72DRAFT_197230 [Fomitopsis betulina]|nr:hypothetical protein C8Q72DRAFT_197230 [Fomitopsis betulina]
MATMADEYDNGQTRESQDEEESEVEVGDGSSDEDVQVLETSKKGKASASKGRGKGKKSRSRDDNGTGTKGDSRGRAMLRELPKEVRLIVTRANMFLRLYICLEKAWTEEKKTGDAKLPNKHMVAKQVISNVWKLRDDEGKPYQHFDLGFKTLNRDNNKDLRNDVFSLIWTGAPQLRNQVKKDAKSVVEDTYGLKNLPAVHRISAALFLLKYNPQGNNSIPNFVFDNIELQWSDDDMDIKASTLNRKRPFQHAAIYTLIARYWFSNPREALMKSTKNVEERFLSMPDNLIVFVCNAIESALADIATGVHQFTNKVYAPKWVNLMDLLKVMKARAPEVHVALKMFLGDSVRKTVAAQQAVKDSKSEEDGNKDGYFMSWKDIEVTMLPDCAGPLGSQDVSERPVGSGVLIPNGVPNGVRMDTEWIPSGMLNGTRYNQLSIRRKGNLHIVA